jgi:hypothetical protein
MWMSDELEWPEKIDYMKVLHLPLYLAVKEAK